MSSSQLSDQASSDSEVQKIPSNLEQNKQPLFPKIALFAGIALYFIMGLS